jgi:branched-chain amino acid transport system permease protein
MAIVGGIGTLFGAFVGAATIIVLENTVSSYTERWPTALGITFIVVMIFAPEGIVGAIRRLFGATRMVELNQLEGTDHGPKAVS